MKKLFQNLILIYFFTFFVGCAGNVLPQPKRYSLRHPYEQKVFQSDSTVSLGGIETPKGISKIVQGTDWALQTEQGGFTFSDGVILVEEDGVIGGGLIKLDRSINLHNHGEAYFSPSTSKIPFLSVPDILTNLEHVCLDDINQARDCFDQALQQMPNTINRLYVDNNGNLMIGPVEKKQAEKIISMIPHSAVMNQIFFDGKRGAFFARLETF